MHLQHQQDASGPLERALESYAISSKRADLKASKVYNGLSVVIGRGFKVLEEE